ncbi:MAG: MoaD/ThiS family protein [Calditrichaeota bacterium]|nr:MAG: MoaD/ThiS family protein [Calditrichota bacterium]
MKTLDKKIKIPVKIPGILTNCTNGAKTIFVSANKLNECFSELYNKFPLLKMHILDENENLRPHILFFYNQENVSWLDSLEIDLKEGDKIQIIQAVSGG